MNRPGRYVRQYRTNASRDNWALYERRDGRARRVGTARSREAYLLFLGFTADEAAAIERTHR